MSSVSTAGSAVRLRLDLAYDGTDFSGWAAQPGRRTVEGELSEALGTLLRVPEPPRLTVAGRTDSGVHARGQVAHCDVDPAALEAVVGRSRRSPEDALLVRLAGVLPHDVVVHRVCRAAAGFDARFSASFRRYSYRIADALGQRDPLRRRDTVWIADRLDEAAMTEASAALVGLHDFAAFCKKRAGASTVRTLMHFTWSREPDGVLGGDIAADAFCHNMVRALVGALVPVGQGRRPVDWPVEVLRSRLRNSRVRVMPARGLCLEQVSYPRQGQLAAQAELARAPRRLPGDEPEAPFVRSEGDRATPE
ncbi:MAG: tRNA pseudouridine(38-40) synthase TruA [Actinomycetales bacterium]|nr:MAG: tRNA pseudouridine(38-40) synthase TruA [Actinomycetales bacterium]